MAKEVYGIAVGKHRGFVVSKLAKRVKPSHRKGTKSKRAVFVREIVREVSGFAPYERRALELLKVSREKRCLKLLKKRLGTHKRGKAKREELTDVLRAMRQAQKH